MGSRKAGARTCHFLAGQGRGRGRACRAPAKHVALSSKCSSQPESAQRGEALRCAGSQCPSLHSKFPNQGEAVMRRLVIFPPPQGQPRCHPNSVHRRQRTWQASGFAGFRGSCVAGFFLGNEAFLHFQGTTKSWKAALVEFRILRLP